MPMYISWNVLQSELLHIAIVDTSQRARIPQVSKTGRAQERYCQCAERWENNISLPWRETNK